MNIEQVVRDYLPTVVHMSLGTSHDNKPWVCEVHFALDEELNLYFRSLASRRHSQEIAENPSVAGNIVRQHQNGEMPMGIYFEGTAERLEPGEALEKAAACIAERLSPPDNIVADASNPDGKQVYKISVAAWYAFGKFGDNPMQKYELAWGQNN